MSNFVTEFEFVLPKGYMDSNGDLHKNGIMRLATAADEILPGKDPRVQSNPSYLIIILLSRVVTKLGGLQDVHPKIIESLFVSDLAYLRNMYENINGNGNVKINVTCPKCEHRFESELTQPE